MYEQWHCEACKKSKTVRYPKGEGVTAVKDRIVWHHRFSSPKCHNANGISMVRVGQRAESSAGESQ